MTGFRKIQSAIVKKLQMNIPEIEIQATDIEEGIERPCFFIDIKDIKLDNFMNKFDEKRITYEILYFPKDRKNNQIDNLDKMDRLREAFVDNNVIKIDEDFLAETENQSLFIVDKILHLTFDLPLSEEYAEEEKELMEDLILEGGLDVNE